MVCSSLISFLHFRKTIVYYSWLQKFWLAITKPWSNFKNLSFVNILLQLDVQD
jgi:hypothetical protein